MEDIDEAIAGIEAFETPLVNELPFHLLERPENKTTKLAAKSDESQAVDGKNKSYNFSFREAVFISTIVVNMTGYNELDRFEIDVTFPEGRQIKFDESPRDGKLVVEISEFVKSIAFRPPTAWIRKPMLQSVVIYGFKKSDTTKFMRFARKLDDLKASTIADLNKARGDAELIIEAAKTAKETALLIKTEIDQASDELSVVQVKIKSANDDLNTTMAKIGASNKQLIVTEERLSNLKSDIKIETQKKEALQADAVTEEGKLRELQKNINLFPSEISGFVDQAAKNSKIYLVYSLVPILIILAMFVLLIVGAADLSTIVTTDKDINLAAIIISRAPYVAVATAIIYASYRIARIFITEVMHINRQRLSMTKIGIIAKDISQAAEDNLRLSTGQIYANRLKVKMALLSDHIRHLIDSDPEILFPDSLFPTIGEDDSEAAEDLSGLRKPAPRRASRGPSRTTTQPTLPNK